MATSTKRSTGRPSKPVTLADVEIRWKETHTERERRISGLDLAQLIRRSLFLGKTDPGETPLWQYRLRGLSALLFPEGGVSVYESDARALLSDLLADAAAGVEYDNTALLDFARTVMIEPKGGRS
ncbi:MAG TPA: hypothetical protein VNN10_00565 [Dehalococcoidia bacterium]|nr:hypothetical protein [Dehalococcoidia bacterium]